MKHDIQIRVDIRFKKNLEKLFPATNGNRARTLKLNEKLEELLYGKKK